MKTKNCPLCRKDVPVREEDGEEVFGNHSRGFRKGPCDASGEPTDVSLDAFYEEKPPWEREMPNV